MNLPLAGYYYQYTWNSWVLGGMRVRFKEGTTIHQGLLPLSDRDWEKERIMGVDLDPEKGIFFIRKCSLACVLWQRVNEIQYGQTLLISCQ